MKQIVVQLGNAQTREFEGELLRVASREVIRDERRSTVFEYQLYRLADGQYALLVESYEKIRARSFFLQFRSSDDVADYVRRDEDGERIAKELLAGVDPSGEDY